MKKGLAGPDGREGIPGLPGSKVTIIKLTFFYTKGFEKCVFR